MTGRVGTVILGPDGAEPSHWAEPEPALCDPGRVWRDMAMPFDAPTVEDGDIHAALNMARKVTWGRRRIKAWPACAHYSPVYPLLAWTEKRVRAWR